MADAFGSDPCEPEMLRAPPSLASWYHMPGTSASVPSTKTHDARRIGRRTSRSSWGSPSRRPGSGLVAAFATAAISGAAGAGGVRGALVGWAAGGATYVGRRSAAGSVAGRGFTSGCSAPPGSAAGLGFSGGRALLAAAARHRVRGASDGGTSLAGVAGYAAGAGTAAAGDVAARGARAGGGWGCSDPSIRSTNGFARTSSPQAAHVVDQPTTGFRQRAQKPGGAASRIARATGPRTAPNRNHLSRRRLRAPATHAARDPKPTAQTRPDCEPRDCKNVHERMITRFRGTGL